MTSHSDSDLSRYADPSVGTDNWTESTDEDETAEEDNEGSDTVDDTRDAVTDGENEGESSNDDAELVDETGDDDSVIAPPPGQRNSIEPDVIEPDDDGIPDENDSDDDKPSMSATRTDVIGDDGSEDTDSNQEFLDLGIVQVNYTTDTIGQDEERATIHLFCRDVTTNKFIRVDVKGFKPYFYTPVDEASSVDRTDSRLPANPVDYTNNGDEFESIRGERLARVSAHIPRTVGSMRDDYTHYEADIQFPDRFLIDKGIQSGVRVPAKWSNEENNVITIEHWEVTPIEADIDLRVHMVDIEVEDRNGFPEAEDAAEQILCITAHDSVTDRYTVWYCDSDDVTEPVPDSVPGYEFLGDNRPGVEIRTFDSEGSMLRDYVAYVNGTDADLLVGWNMVDFDAEYLINRIDNLEENHNVGISSDQLSPINEVWGGGWKGPNVKGRVVFDLLEAYKRTQFSELDSYRLDYIGEHELDAGKEVFDGDIGELWESDPAQLIEYNLRDVELCVELNRQEEIIPFWDEVQQFVGCRLQDATTPGDAVDMYVLHKLSDRYVLPSKGTVETGDDDYEGGAVFEPITGIKDYVTVLDLKSLYPMCMVTINASPETKVTDPESYDGELFHAPNDVYYEKGEDGVIREMVTELLDEREKKKERRNEFDTNDPEYHLFDRQQGAVKVIMNSLYGVLGWDRFRLYDKDNASAVTATGRAVIEKTEDAVNDLGLEATYGDTDSVMISLDMLNDDHCEHISNEVKNNGPDWNNEKLQIFTHALKKSREIEEYINESYNDFAKEQLNADEHNFIIEFEKLYWKFLQAGKKKRYGGNIIWKEGKFVNKVDITGFESERSDIPPLTREAQTKVIEMLVTDKGVDAVREYLNDLIDNYLAGEYSYDKIGIPGGIGKKLDEYDTPTAQVRGAIYANEVLGTNFGQATKPKRLYLDRIHYDFYRYCEEELGLESQTNKAYREFKQNEDVICFAHEQQIPDEFEVDHELMMEKTLQKPLSRVLKAVDLSWEEVKVSQEQTGLQNFM